MWKENMMEIKEFFEKYPEFLEYGMKKNAEDQKVNVLKIPNDSAAADIKKGA